MNTLKIKRELDETLRRLESARRFEKWANAEAEARYAALLARRMQLEADPDPIPERGKHGVCPRC